MFFQLTSPLLMLRNSSFFRLLACRDEWFSDDLKKLDDDNVYRKMQGRRIIEMSEMIATANAKSIEEIKSFLSRQKSWERSLSPDNEPGAIHEISDEEAQQLGIPDDFPG